MSPQGARTGSTEGSGVDRAGLAHRKDAFMKKLTLRLTVFWLAGALAGSASLSAAEPLRVGVDTRSPPWAFVPGLDYSREDATKDPAITSSQLRKLVGLDVDVAQALGRRLGVPVRFVPVAWFDLEQALIARRIDIILCAWTPRGATPSEIASSKPYAEWGLLTAVRAGDGSIRSFADLAGKRVGHFRSGVVGRTLSAVSAAKLLVYDSQEKLFDDLKARVVDAVLYDSPYVLWRVANDEAFRVVGEPLNRLGYHAGVRAADVELLRQVQTAVEDLVSSGEARQLQQKWAKAP
jgi:polar amino acid transport system substrate-binding protein